MNENPILTKLYYLIVMADGVINEKEVELGKKMVAHLNLDENRFNEHIQALRKRIYNDIYSEAVRELKKLTPLLQIEYLAWIGLVANADGFMDKKEWELIYKLYSKELHLNLQDIINKQRDLVGIMTRPLKVKKEY